ncbi:MAG: YvcK family protein [Candidatus Andersenbacteria bacterium]|nr:YvcK family protein [Candidatus Andersenbacteria bacterium]MBI3250778.1 YvcK family protein [Candidatus Andersenbacteria bacterium]
MAIPGKEVRGVRVVVLGGGNGTSRVLKALLPLLHEEKIASLHALVHMADDGGSSGRLRAQYAVGSMGDLTRCLLALSRLRGDIRGERFIRALEYRFASGDFRGHTLRNALLAALELTSDLDAAVATFARILQIPKYAGAFPTTLTPLTQQVELAGEILGSGQHHISWNVDLQAKDTTKPGDVVVTFAEGKVQLNPRAVDVLKVATHIIVAPGHTYGTILPTLASLQPHRNLEKLLADKKLVVLMTLLTTPKQTSQWSGEDFVRVYESYLGRSVDIVIGNTGMAKVDLVSGQDWVQFTEKDHPYQLLQENIVSTEEQAAQTGDTVPRAVVVHDEDKIRQIFTSHL